MGGIHATFMYNDILRDCPDVDIVVRYEGELTMVELVQAIEQGSSLGKVKGIAFRDEGGQVRVTDQRPRIDRLDQLPMPAYDKVELDRYSNDFSIITSRGCPFRCVFCSTSSFHGHIVRKHSVERVMSEVDYAIQHGFGHILFEDDVFTVDRDRTLSICESLALKKVEWHCNTRADLLDPDLLQRMASSGCKTLFLGVESGSQRMLDNCGKKLNLEVTRNVIRLARENGIGVEASFILGLPGENEHSILETTNYIRAIDVNILKVNILIPYPGTDIWDHPEKYDIRILTKDWNKYSHLLPVVETGNLSCRDLLWHRLDCLRQFHESHGSPYVNQLSLSDEYERRNKGGSLKANELRQRRPQPKALWAAKKGEVYLTDQTGIYAFHLNAIGSLIWRMCVASLPVRDIIDVLTGMFGNCHRAEINRDVLYFVTELKKLDLIDLA